MLKSLHEKHQARIETSKTNELDRGEEASECEQTGEQLADIGCQLQIDVNVAIALHEQTTDSIQLAITPNEDAHIGPRTDDDAHVDVRPELTEIVSLELEE